MCNVVPPCPGYRHLSGLALHRDRLSAATRPIGGNGGDQHYLADGSTAAASG